ncbi:hypothetical protein [Aquiflexum sp.]|uniref:hypothetical protein n=1 Tax=Aquiflexum sp. TaxID=1872584 RepID=UPI00359315A5
MFLRKILDVKIKNNQISVTRDANISVIDLENQIRSHPYTGQNLDKSEETEKSKVPPFIQVFYFLFFKNLTVPSEKEFCETYISWLGGAVDGKITYEGTELKADFLINRMKRTYPSLIRDLHFLYLIEEARVFDDVEYSMHMDYFKGLDLKVTNKGKIYFVSLFIDTPRGQYYKKRKMFRHDYSEIIEIELNVDFASLKKVGNIFLLKKEHVGLLVDRINS